MVDAKWLGLLLALQCLLVSNVTTGSKTNSRQLDIPAMKSFFPLSRAKDSKRPAPGVISDVGLGAALQSEPFNNEQFQQESSCEDYSVNCSSKTLLLGGATNSMSVRRPDIVNLGVPIKISTNGYQVPANNEAKVFHGRYGTSSAYRTVDSNDWTPINHVRQAQLPPTLRKPSTPSLGVPIKTPTSNIFHARTNHKGGVNIVSTVNNKNIDGTHGKIAGRNNLSFGKPIKWGVNPNPAVPSTKNVGQQVLLSPAPRQIKPFKASPQVVTTAKIQEPIRNKKTTTKSQRSNVNSPDEVQQVSPSPGVDFPDSIPKPNKDDSLEKPTQTSSDVDPGIIPISLLPLSPVSEFINYNERDPSPFNINGDPVESVFSVPTTTKSKTPNSQALISDNFYDGHFDDIGVVSSFSYFHHPDWAKGFEEYFNTQAGGKIAKEFHSNMFDHAGFPGKVRKNPESQLVEKKKRNEPDYIRRMQDTENRKTRKNVY